MSEKTTLKISKPFGPTLGFANIPESLIYKINNFIDNEVVGREKKIIELDAGSDLVGQVTQEIKLPPEIIKGELYEFLYKATKAYIKLSINKEISRFDLLSTWVVRQFENEYNPLHFHAGHISGVGYLKIPENFGEITHKQKPSTHGNINFVHGSKQFLSNGYVSQKPRIGDFYFFPHYLYHSVNPFYGSGERRSISFNALINDEIYKVYGLDN